MLYEFGPFRLEPDEHLLLREGQPAAARQRHEAFQKRFFDRTTLR